MLCSSSRGLSAKASLLSSFLSYARVILLTALFCSLAPSAFAQTPADELVKYPSEEVAYICGPQLKSGSALNPYPWFDRTAIDYGRQIAAEIPAIAPRILTGTVSVRSGSTTVDGVGTRFTLEVDPNGPAPLYNGWLRVKMADGTYTEMKVASVTSDTRLVLTTAWSGANASGVKADTYHYEPTRWQWNYDRYYDTAYYDVALTEYVNYYRTGDPQFLTYARRAADSWWSSPYINHGTVTGGPDNLPPRSMAYAGLMLRALDGRPEMWDYLERQTRATFDNWVGYRLSDATLYYDIREDGYAQLYAVMMARLLPDTYSLQGNGTLSPATGAATDGAQKRTQYLRDTSRAAVDFFGRLQKADGSWRWDVEGMGLVKIEQPFMIGIYLESVVALDRIATDPAVKASLRSQLEKSVRHLYTQAYRGNETVSDLSQYHWRGMWYFWGGGTTADPTAYERGVGYGEMVSGGDPGMIRQVRHLNSTVHHAFGYAYALTGNSEYLKMGDEIFDASYGEKVDGIHGQANTGRGKDYSMNYRASGKFLAWRLGQVAPTPTPTPTPVPTPVVTPTPTPTPAPTPAPTPVVTPTPTPAPTPTPTPTGKARSSLHKARQDAQSLSNELATTTTNSFTSGASAAAQSPADRIAAVVADVQQTYIDFSNERTFYPAPTRIEAALSSSLAYAASAGNYAGQGQMAEAKSSLQKAIDNMELADVLMTYGDVQNPLDYSQYFVRQHYVDFLGREPDETGRAFWQNQIEQCGSNAQCVEVKRINVSAAYFLSIEFKETGFLVHRLYRATLGRTVLFREFQGDTQEVSKGLIVGELGWQDRLAANKSAFFKTWVQRTDFKARYDSMTNAQFVDSIYASMGVAAQAAERDSLVSSLQTGAATRADALAKLVDNADFSRLERNRAFVLMQYFGYMRRDPDEVGFNFWLGHLEEFNGDFVRAEMVKAFLSSDEYRNRFRQQ